MGSYLLYIKEDHFIYTKEDKMEQREASFRYKKFIVDVKNYRLIKELNSGGFGSVCSVENLETGEYCAAKVLDTHKDPMQYKRMINREIGIMIRCQHPTIIKFMGYSLHDFDAKNNVMIFMELAKKGSLAELLQKVQNGLVEDIYDNTTRQIILVGVARGMMFLHQNQIIHRDLKPGNILLDEDFHPHITDFGLSKMNDSMKSVSQSQSCGTSMYMAPEVIEGDKYNGKADVYAFGILMYEVVTDSSPYPQLINGRMSAFQFNNKIVNEDFRPKFTSPIKKTIKKLIERCWARDPHERPTFEEIFKKLAYNIEDAFEDIYDYQDEEADGESKVEEEDNTYYLEDVDVDEVISYADDIAKENAGADAELISKVEKLLKPIKEENEKMKIQLEKFQKENEQLKKEIEEANEKIEKVSEKKEEEEEENELEERLARSIQKISKDVEERDKEIRQDLNQSIKDLKDSFKDDLEGVTDDKDKLEEKIEEMNKAIEKLKKENEKIKKENENNKQAYEEMKEKVSKLEEKLEKGIIIQSTANASQSRSDSQNKKEKEVSSNQQQQQQQQEQEPPKSKNDKQQEPPKSKNDKQQEPPQSKKQVPKVDISQQQQQQQQQQQHQQQQKETPRNDSQDVSESKEEPENSEKISARDSNQMSKSGRKLFGRRKSKKSDAPLIVDPIDAETITITEFNKLPLQYQQTTIAELITKVTNKKVISFFNKINGFLSYLIPYNQNNPANPCFEIAMHSKIEILSQIKGEHQVRLLGSGTEVLIRSDSFNWPDFTNHLTKFSDASIEINYPSSRFKAAYETVSYLQSQHKESIKIAIFVSKNDLKFKGDTAITTVKLDSSVTSIEGDRTKGGSFEDCSTLANVFIPNSITKIEENAFLRCTSLSYVIFEDLSNLSSIGYCAFCRCVSLKQINLPPSLKRIGTYAFSQCESLKEVVIPLSVQIIKPYAFSGCKKLTSVTIPQSVTTIGEYAFDGCSSLKSVTIPASVQTLGEFAFRGCSSLKEASLSVSSSSDSNDENKAAPVLAAINESTFKGCSSLVQIVIPASVKKVGNEAFADCSSLKQVTLSPCLTSIAESTFSKCTSMQQITIPSSVTIIETNAFNGCTALKQVAFPSYLKTISSSAFAGCSSLELVLMPKSVKNIANDAFPKNTKVIKNK